MGTLTQAVRRCFAIQQDQKTYLCQGACLIQWFLHGWMETHQHQPEDKGAGQA